MEQSPSWEANIFTAHQEIPYILWKERVHNPDYNSLPLLCILSQINPLNAELNPICHLLALLGAPTLAG
jgi:hypothetical protein